MPRPVPMPAGPYQFIRGCQKRGISITSGPPWLGWRFIWFSMSMISCWLAALRAGSRASRIRPSPEAGPGMQNSRPSDGTIGQAPACNITSGISQSACISVIRPFSKR